MLKYRHFSEPGFDARDDEASRIISGACMAYTFIACLAASLARFLDMANTTATVTVPFNQQECVLSSFSSSNSLILSAGSPGAPQGHSEHLYLPTKIEYRLHGKPPPSLYSNSSLSPSCPISSEDLTPFSSASCSSPHSSPQPSTHRTASFGTTQDIACTTGGWPPSPLF